MTRISREKARTIVIHCFNKYAQTPIPDTEDGEMRDVQGTLEHLSELDRTNVWRCIVGTIESQNGCTTTLGPGKFITAHYSQVRGVVADVINTTNCP